MRIRKVPRLKVLDIRHVLAPGLSPAMLIWAAPGHDEYRGWVSECNQQALLITAGNDELIRGPSHSAYISSVFLTQKINFNFFPFSKTTTQCGCQ